MGAMYFIKLLFKTDGIHVKHFTSIEAGAESEKKKTKKKQQKHMRLSGICEFLKKYFLLPSCLKKKKKESFIRVVLGLLHLLELD